MTLISQLNGWLLALLITPAANLTQMSEAQVSALAGLESALAAYTPGSAISDEVRDRIDAAAAALEATASVPDLIANPDLARGIWVNRFSSQGVVGEIDLQFMTRAMPGGGQPGRKAQSLTVIQELNPDQRFYRNMMTMTAGEDDIPFLYVATADLGVSEAEPNVLEVAFHTIAFVPGRADVTHDQLRSVLGVGENAPLSIVIPLDPARPPATSTVTYLDDRFRINRGKDYVAVLERVR
ncbi:MAG: PAP/fibrillin family protein [Pseudomonadota bacterium]